MREKLQRFMTGRYGADELGRTLNIVVLVSLVVSMFSGLLPVLSIFYWFGIALMIYNCFRMFSKNVSKRYEENQRYLSRRYKAVVKRDQWKKRFATERYLPLFQVSWMQAESAGAEGKRQNLYYLPEVQERIHQKKLIWQGKGELGMFGYININQKIMTEENRKAYQAYYCGLCQRLKSNCGAKGQMLLNYDMTFLIVLLTGLYELTNESSEITCALHPTKKRQVWINEATDYAADMNLIVAYHNLIDDWKDEKAYTKKAFAKMLDKDYARVIEKYPRQVHAVEEFMRKTDEVEARGETNLDVVAGLTGEMLGEIFCWREDEWQEELRTLGFYMGKFIYIMDAYEDYDEDRRKKEYNPLVYAMRESADDMDTLCRLLLTSMMSECAKSFERLPILLHADILRNVLYSGVWSKYEYLQLKKRKAEEKNKKKARK